MFTLCSAPVRWHQLPRRLQQIGNTQTQVRTAFERLFQGSFGNTACDTPQSALNILTRVYIPTKEPLIYPNTFANACTTLKIAFDTPKIAFDTPKTALNTP